MKKITAILLIAAALGVMAAGYNNSRHRLILGDERSDIYLPLLAGQRVALLSNQTGVIRQADGSLKHVLDYMIEQGVQVTAIFSPEHGFRGTADAGELVRNDIDEQTGVPILSLYSSHGSNYPSDESMAQFDVLVVDIQDVGLRYYTYYITMCRLIEACGAHDKRVLIFDRPNPNGMYVDGPILDMSLKSGVGLLPIPVVHGLTLGELALMAQGMQWLDSVGNTCDVRVVPCKHYTHQTRYELPGAPICRTCKPSISIHRSARLRAHLSASGAVRTNRSNSTAIRAWRTNIRIRSPLAACRAPRPRRGWTKSASVWT